MSDCSATVSRALVASVLLLAIALLALRPSLAALSGYPLLSDGALLSMTICIGLGVISHGTRPWLYRRPLIVFGLAVVAASYFVLHYVVVGVGTDEEMMRRTATLPISVAAAYYVAWLSFLTFRTDPRRILGMVLISSAGLQGVLVLAQVLSPDVHQFVRSIVAYPEDPSGPRYLYWSGFRPMGGDALSLNQATLILAGLGLVVAAEKDERMLSVIAFTWLVLAVAFAVVATVASGRTGAYLLLLCGLLWFVGTFSRSLLSGKLEKTVLAVFAGLVMLTVASVLLYSSPLGESLVFIDRLLRPQATMEIVREEQIGWHVVPINLVVGSGEFGREGGRYLATDVGWFRLFYGAGLFGVVAALMPFVGAAVLQRQEGLLWLLLFFGALGQFKIVYLPTIVFSFVYFLVFSCCFFHGRTLASGDLPRELRRSRY